MKRMNQSQAFQRIDTLMPPLYDSFHRNPNTPLIKPIPPACAKVHMPYVQAGRPAIRARINYEVFTIEFKCVSTQLDH
eukprot:scaffold249541_cov37-Prasinocladus_malaysianus.AAC.1